eukprot:jgi/Ulvmu1/10293/UM060_0095.1
MSSLKSICVFCGSSKGTDPAHARAARELGSELARRGIRLVYGGGNVGLMGEVARAARAADGAVLGVIPKELVPREVSGEMIGETRIARDMHDRKATMAAEADAFIALPGGFGTLEELMEIVTWQQLGYHGKPVGVLNINDFYLHFMRFLDHCQDQGFLRKDCRKILIERTDVAELIDALASYTPPTPVIEVIKQENAANGA